MVTGASRNIGVPRALRSRRRCGRGNYAQVREGAKGGQEIPRTASIAVFMADMRRKCGEGYGRGCDQALGRVDAGDERVRSHERLSGIEL